MTNTKTQVIYLYLIVYFFERIFKIYNVKYLFINWGSWNSNRKSIFKYFSITFKNQLQIIDYLFVSVIKYFFK